MKIKQAYTEAEIRLCYPVMAQLRPTYSEEEFVVQFQRQMADHAFELAYAEVEGDGVTAVAGFFRSETLAWGRFLYVADLVTDTAHRSKGHGEALLDWLVAYAREHNCEQVHLDSGVQRFGAHRFYFRQNMHISSYHFALKL